MNFGQRSNTSRFLSVPKILAQMLDDTFLASWVLWAANMATVSNHVQVKPILDFVGNDLVKQLVGFRFRHFFVQPTKPFAYPKDVSVNWKDRFPETEEQDTGCSFRSDTRQLFEPCERFIGRHPFKEIKGQVAVIGVSDLLQYCLDSRRFLV